MTDIFKKVRDENERPPWTGVDAHTYLLYEWKKEDFKKLFQLNKINRSSSRGGTVHMTSHRAHHGVALKLMYILFVITMR